MSQSLASREVRVLDASQLDGPDPLADILSFLGMDEDDYSAVLSEPSSEPSYFERELAAEAGRAWAAWAA